MTTSDNLEQHLSELTTYRGPESQLWQKALDRNSADSRAGSSSIFAKRIPQPMLAGLAACIVLILAVGMLLPSIGKARGKKQGPVPAVSAPSEVWKRVGRPQDSLDLSGGEHVDLELQKASVEGQRAEHVGGPKASANPETRHVIQKSTIELQTPDVRAVFAKASHLIASGEFVENSSLTGDGKAAQANLTLRVAASRLSEVLNQLRELGTVKSENTTGEDVTSQVVDLEARIRNEQRIEKELLELLDKRADAPLKDILELRTSLSSVRQTIEQYIAQRDRLSRLVSLASILVVIRAERESARPEPQQSILTYFQDTIADAWRGGLRTASDSVSWLLGLLVSGILWWLLIAAAIYSMLRYRRRLAARCV